MRIVLVTNGLGFGGAERVVESLALGLTRAKDQVLVVATTRGGVIEDRIRQAGVPVRVLNLKSPFDARVPISLRAAVRDFSADLVHSHLAVSDIAVTVGLARSGRPRVSTVHHPAEELGGAKAWLWKRALVRFSAVTAVSLRVARTLPVKAQVVHPSLVRLDEMPLSKAEARRRLGLDPEAQVVMGVGRLSPIKGFDVFDEAARRLPPSVQCVVIGEGSQRPRLRTLRLLGARADAAQLIAACDLFVQPSRNEGFPLAVLEALAAERYVVATRVGGTPELLSPEVGTLISPEDPKALAEAISGALHHNPPCPGRAYLRARGWTEDAMVQRFRRLYLDLVAMAD